MSKNNNNITQQANSPSISTTRKETEKEPLYFASLYRYSCAGHVRASSTEKDDRICRGIQYGLQHAAESHRTITRQEATRDFALLNGTAKDRQQVSPGIPSSLNEALKTQAVVIGNNEQAEINDKEWNDIDSYGITDVEVLVLEDAKTRKSQVASVAPHTFVGNSVRNVGTKEGTIMSATVHLGPLEITLDSGVEEHDDNPHVSKQTPKQQETKKNAAPARQADSEGSSRGTDVVQLSKKVADNMVKGASMLKDAVSEDFPSRMYNASHRVVGQMGNTVERTGKVCKSLYRMWFDDDNEDQQ